MKYRLSAHGFEIKRKLISGSRLNSLIKDINSLNRNLPCHGLRNADKKIPSIATLSKHRALLRLVQAYLKAPPKVVRCILFDKTAEKNWLVTWHQDKTVTVNKTFSQSGWSPWSVKDNTHHVQPPIQVLEQMLTIRIHLDPADRNNGCLKIIPQSHQLGILSNSQIQEITQQQKPVHCEVEAGDALFMKPHILHSSSKSLKPRHRRIVHIEYSCHELPSGIEWA